MRTSPFFRLALVAASLALATSCKEDDTAKQVEELKLQVKSELDALRLDAETRDPSRTNLKATFVDTSVLALRPTSNPDRPYVGHVRIKWRFEYTDGRPLGDAVFDYVYAMTPDKKWIKADDPNLGPEFVPPSKDTSEDPPVPAQSATARRPA
jgi:hypothetical protein